MGMIFKEEDNSSENMKWFGYIGVLFIMLIIAIPHFTSEQHFSFIDYVNLGFHEAGHFILGVLGNQFIHVLGGTLGQLFVPSAFTVYFLFFRRDYRAACFTMFWLFENLINISIYLADAQVQQLPLLGSDDGSGHDWVYLCAELKCITKAPAMAHMLRVTGLLGMVASFFTLMAMLLVKNPFTGSPVSIPSQDSAMAEPPQDGSTSAPPRS